MSDERYRLMLELDRAKAEMERVGRMLDACPIDGDIAAEYGHKQWPYSDALARVLKHADELSNSDEQVAFAAWEKELADLMSRRPAMPAKSEDSIDETVMDALKCYKDDTQLRLDSCYHSGRQKYVDKIRKIDLAIAKLSLPV